MLQEFVPVQAMCCLYEEAVIIVYGEQGGMCGLQQPHHRQYSKLGCMVCLFGYLTVTCVKGALIKTVVVPPDRDT
jgi:hypothetical protein